MRTIACLSLAISAVFFALVGSAIPLMLASQATKDKAYYRQFEAAATYIDKHGKLPTNEMGGWQHPGNAGLLIIPSLDIPDDCGESLKKAAADHLILSFWRGEWTECYAYPSGRTTLPKSVKAYLLSGLGVHIVIYWVIAAATAWGAIRLRPNRGASKLGTPSNS